METQVVTVTHYKIATVFDVSQTEGRELPTLGVDRLPGEVENYQHFYDSLLTISPVPVTIEAIPGQVNGYFSRAEQRIVIQEGMSQLQTIKTLIHEISHAKLHDPAQGEMPKGKRKKEVEAESIAYVVCQHFGIDTSDYSFGYVAGWSQGMTMVVYLASQLVLEKRTFVTITGKATRERTLIEEQHIAMPLTFICGAISVVVVGIYIMIPIVSFVKLWGVDYSLTFDNYIMGWKVAKQALMDTVKLAVITTPITGIIAMIMAFLIVRKKNFLSKPMEAAGMVGMIIPGTIVGYAYVLLFNNEPFLLTGTFLILVASCCSRYLPVGLRSGITSLQQIDPSIEEAASDLGANSLQVFTKVTLPLIKSSFFGGLVYTFVRTMTSMSAMIFLISAKHKLLTISILDQVDRGKYGAASAMSTMLIIVVYIAIILIYQVLGFIGVNKKDIKLM